MAKCLAEYKPRFAPSAPEDAPVLAQLRLAIGSANPDEVEAAAFGLTQTATAGDLQSIVAAATRVPAVAVTLSSDLWQVCRVDAIEGARAITATSHGRPTTRLDGSERGAFDRNAAAVVRI
jgi:hypothetical protein